MSSSGQKESVGGSPDKGASSIKKFIKDIGLTYIIKMFNAITLYVRPQSVTHNLPILRQIIKNRDPQVRVHLVYWMAGPDLLTALRHDIDKVQFEQIWLQGDFLLPSYQPVIATCILQTLHLRLEGCTIKVTPDLLHETAQQLGHLKHLSMKDVRVTNLAGLLEKCYNLREFKFHSLQNSDVLSTFAY